jgi:phenylalanyl-tRNA synthetase beta chain
VEYSNVDAGQKVPVNNSTVLYDATGVAFTIKRWKIRGGGPRNICAEDE